MASRPGEGEVTGELTRAERQLRLFMGICAAVYAVGGIGFAVLNDHMIQNINELGAKLGLGAAPLGNRLWLALAVSMMLTIATCAYLVYRDVRRNRFACVPVIVSKAVSSAAGLTFFFIEGQVFAYLVVMLTDLPLFFATLWLFRRAGR